MGEAADAILEGDCCQYCGEYFHDDSPGHPRSCGCEGEDKPKKGSVFTTAKREKRRRYRQRRAERRRQSLEMETKLGHLSGWEQLSKFHHRKDHAGQRIDYWPSTRKFMIRGEVFFGDAKEAIAKAEGMK